MGQEIERKFLVIGDEWRAQAAAPRLVRQGYLASSATASVRVRIIGSRAYLTVKSAGAGLIRSEFEYTIPIAEADAMLTHLCAPSIIRKRRYELTCNELDWIIANSKTALRDWFSPRSSFTTLIRTLSCRRGLGAR